MKKNNINSPVVQNLIECISFNFYKNHIYVSIFNIKDVEDQRLNNLLKIFLRIYF